MNFSSGSTVLSENNYLNNSSTGPICKEYTITVKNGLHYKTALLVISIISAIHNLIFIDYEDIKNKYFVLSIFAGLIIYFVISLSYTVEKESLLLVVPLTIQITTTYIFGNETTFSLAWETLGDLMIMEVIMGQRVHYFLSITIIDNKRDNELEHVILFRNSKPPLKCLEVLYRDIQLNLDRSR